VQITGTADSTGVCSDGTPAPRTTGGRFGRPATTGGGSQVGTRRAKAWRRVDPGQQIPLCALSFQHGGGAKTHPAPDGLIPLITERLCAASWGGCGRMRSSRWRRWTFSGSHRSRSAANGARAGQRLEKLLWDNWHTRPGRAGEGHCRQGLSGGQRRRVHVWQIYKMFTRADTSTAGPSESAKHSSPRGCSLYQERSRDDLAGSPQGMRERLLKRQVVVVTAAARTWDRIVGGASAGRGCGRRTSPTTNESSGW